MLIFLIIKCIPVDFCISFLTTFAPAKWYYPFCQSRRSTDSLPKVETLRLCLPEEINLPAFRSSSPDGSQEGPQKVTLICSDAPTAYASCLRTYNYLYSNEFSSLYLHVFVLFLRNIHLKTIPVNKDRESN